MRDVEVVDGGYVPGDFISVTRFLYESAHDRAAIVPMPIPDAMVERAAREEFFALRPDGSWSLQRRDTKAAYMERARMILTAALTPKGK